MPSTALAHELAHAALWRLGVEDGDSFHRGPEWLPQGLVEEAAGALATVQEGSH